MGKSGREERAKDNRKPKEEGEEGLDPQTESAALEEWLRNQAAEMSAGKNQTETSEPATGVVNVDTESPTSVISPEEQPTVIVAPSASEESVEASDQIAVKTEKITTIPALRKKISNRLTKILNRFEAGSEAAKRLEKIIDDWQAGKIGQDWQSAELVAAEKQLTQAVGFSDDLKKIIQKPDAKVRLTESGNLPASQTGQILQRVEGILNLDFGAAVADTNTQENFEAPAVAEEPTEPVPENLPVVEQAPVVKKLDVGLHKVKEWQPLELDKSEEEEKVFEPKPVEALETPETPAVLTPEQEAEAMAWLNQEMTEQPKRTIDSGAKIGKIEKFKREIGDLGGAEQVKRLFKFGSEKEAGGAGVWNNVYDLAPNWIQAGIDAEMEKLAAVQNQDLSEFRKEQPPAPEIKIGDEVKYLKSYQDKASGEIISRTYTGKVVEINDKGELKIKAVVAAKEPGGPAKEFFTQRQPDKVRLVGQTQVSVDNYNNSSIIIRQLRIEATRKFLEERLKGFKDGAAVLKLAEAEQKLRQGDQEPASPETEPQAGAPEEVAPETVETELPEAVEESVQGKQPQKIVEASAAKQQPSEITFSAADVADLQEAMAGEKLRERAPKAVEAEPEPALPEPPEIEPLAGERPSTLNLSEQEALLKSLMEEPLAIPAETLAENQEKINELFRQIEEIINEIAELDQENKWSWRESQENCRAALNATNIDDQEKIKYFNEAVAYLTEQLNSLEAEITPVATDLKEIINSEAEIDDSSGWDNPAWLETPESGDLPEQDQAIAAVLEETLEKLSPEQQEEVKIGAANFGFFVKEQKSKFFAKLFKTIAPRGQKKIQERGALARFLSSLSETYQNDAKSAREKIKEISKLKKAKQKTDLVRHKLPNVGNFFGMIIKTGRTITDFTGYSLVSPFRYVMMGSMAFARGAEAAKEARLKKAEVIEKVRIEEVEKAADEAWDLYEQARAKAGIDREVSPEDFNATYLESLPQDLKKRLGGGEEKSKEASENWEQIREKYLQEPPQKLEKNLKEKRGKLSNLVQGLISWDVKRLVEKINKKIADLEKNQPLSEEQKQAAKEKIIASYARRLKTLDKMVSQFGTVDALAMGAQYLETGAKAVVTALTIETLILSVEKLFESLPAFFEHSHQTETLIDSAGTVPAPAVAPEAIPGSVEAVAPAAENSLIKALENIHGEKTGSVWGSVDAHLQAGAKAVGIELSEAQRTHLDAEIIDKIRDDFPKINLDHVSQEQLATELEKGIRQEVIDAFKPDSLVTQSFDLSEQDKANILSNNARYLAVATQVPKGIARGQEFYDFVDQHKNLNPTEVARQFVEQSHQVGGAEAAAKAAEVKSGLGAATAKAAEVKSGLGAAAEKVAAPVAEVKTAPLEEFFPGQGNKADITNLMENSSPAFKELNHQTDLAALGIGDSGGRVAPYKVFIYDKNGDGVPDSLSLNWQGKVVGLEELTISNRGEVLAKLKDLAPEIGQSTKNVDGLAEALGDKINRGQAIDLIGAAREAGLTGFLFEKGIVPNTEFDVLLKDLAGGNLELIKTGENFDLNQLRVFKELCQVTANPDLIRTTLNITKALPWESGQEGALAKILVHGANRQWLTEIFGSDLVNQETNIDVSQTGRLLFHHLGDPAMKGKSLEIDLTRGTTRVLGRGVLGMKKELDLKGLDKLNDALNYIKEAVLGKK